MPADGFVGRALVDCPDVGDDARGWWAVWATSEFAHAFGGTEWQDLADTSRVMDRYYATGEPKHLAEARQHTAGLFGLAARARLHVSVEAPAEAPAPVRRVRRDPRAA